MWLVRDCLLEPSGPQENLETQALPQPYTESISNLIFGSVFTNYLLHMQILKPIQLDPLCAKRKLMTFTCLCVNTNVQFTTKRKIIILDEIMHE
ncbi:hypothetical protein V2J09_005972 [Rumex salicifolius]